MKYSLLSRFGYFQYRLPQKTWDEVPDITENTDALCFVPEPGKSLRAKLKAIDLQNAGRPTNVLEDAEAVLRGEFTFFSFHQRNVGLPPDWYKNHFTGEMVPRDVHWSRLSDFDYGDVKVIWELSRFPWAFSLARAYARTTDERYSECFWTLFENWLEANPPNTGPNWKCGQEASFRLIAAAFARRVFSSSVFTTPKRLSLWRKFVFATGERILVNLPYALSQSNNHGISECVGLITASAILGKNSERNEWYRTAFQELRKQVLSLVYEDGSFSQHSIVYHRVLLHILAWYILLEQSSNTTVDCGILDAANRATTFAKSLTDLDTGHAPLCGNNDGSNILPLTDVDYLDLRPTLRMSHDLLGIALDLKEGPWDEASLWISKEPNNGRASSSFLADQEGLLFSAQIGGWYVARNDESRLFLHAPKTFRHRPKQADLLHVDIWYQGYPITRDPGSYSYNASDKFSGALKETAVHNTLSIDGADQMKRVRRFLYLPWANCVVSRSDIPCILEASHDGYADFGFRHVRRITIDDKHTWVIEDEAVRVSEQSFPHGFRLHWLFADWPYQFVPEDNTVVLKTPRGDYTVCWEASIPNATASTVRADADSERGWWSPYYYHVSPAISLAIAMKSCESVKFVTRFRPAASFS